jgi:excisionase family DNA binding protein
MTGPVSEGRGDDESAIDFHLTAIQRREAAVAAARRFLGSLALDDIQHLPADALRDRLGSCRALLEEMAEASRSPQPLARTVDEAAAALRVSALTVYRLVNSGDLAAYRISRRLIRIDETALRSYLAGHAVDAGGVADGDISEQHIRPAWH